jgi:hypothetical protein
MLYKEEPADTTKRLLELINLVMKNYAKSVAFIYMNIEFSENKIMNVIPFTSHTYKKLTQNNLN